MTTPKIMITSKTSAKDSPIVMKKTKTEVMITVAMIMTVMTIMTLVTTPVQTLR